MADLARAVLIAAIVLEVGVVVFLQVVYAPSIRTGAADRGTGALRTLLLVAGTIAAVAAVAGLVAGPDIGRQHTGWLLATVAAALAVALVLAPPADARRLTGRSPRAWLLALAAAALLAVPALLGHAAVASAWLVVPARSEERRVGKECRL